MRSVVVTIGYRHVETGPERQGHPPRLYYHERFKTYQKNKLKKKKKKDLRKITTKKGILVQEKGANIRGKR